METERTRLTTEEANQLLFEQNKSELLRQGKRLKFMIDEVGKKSSDQFITICDIAYEIIRYASAMSAFRDAQFMKEQSEQEESSIERNSREARERLGITDV